MKKQKLNIKYPCKWGYRVVGESEELMRQAIAECIRGLEHELSVANTSRSGKYISLNLELIVPDEKTRKHIHSFLMKHSDVRTVV